MTNFPHKYQVAIWWSEDDEAFLAMAPQLPRCIADGPTHEEALTALNEVVDIWMEMAREEGWDVPQPPGHILPLRDEFDWQPVHAKESAPQTQNAAKTIPSPRRNGRVVAPREKQPA